MIPTTDKIIVFLWLRLLDPGSRAGQGEDPPRPLPPPPPYRCGILIRPHSQPPKFSPRQRRYSAWAWLHCQVSLQLVAKLRISNSDVPECDVLIDEVPVHVTLGFHIRQLGPADAAGMGSTEDTAV